MEGLQSDIQNRLNAKEEKAAEAAQNKVKKILALILFISSSALQLLSHEDLEETIEELLECARRIKENLDAAEDGSQIQKKRKTDQKKAKKVTKEEDGSKPVDVLVDIIMSLLTRCPGKIIRNNLILIC